LTISSILEEVLLKMGLQGKINLLSESTATNWCLIGDNTKAKENLLWQPRKAASEILIEMINKVDAQ
jgi:GDP-D-mannose dehydratase